MPVATTDPPLSTLNGDAASAAFEASSAVADTPPQLDDSPAAGAPPCGDDAPAEDGSRRRRKRGRRRAPKSGVPFAFDFAGPGQGRGRGMAHFPQPHFPAVGRGSGMVIDTGGGTVWAMWASGPPTFSTVWAWPTHFLRSFFFFFACHHRGRACRRTTPYL